MKRIMCVWLPNWPIQRRAGARMHEAERRNRVTENREPRTENDLTSRFSVLGSPLPGCLGLVLFAPAERGRVVVVACSSAARRHGVKPGMLLAEAQALCPSGVRFEPHDPPADRAALRDLAGWCGQFSPAVALDTVEPPDGLLLDVTGCGYGYGGEAGLANAVVASLRERGYTATAAIADTVGCAWAVACYASDQSAITLIPPGAHAEALAPLPVAALRLSADAVALLRDFDVGRIEQLLALRRADLPSRFGPELLVRLDQALGAAAEVLTPERPPDLIEVAWTFEPPATDRQMLDAVVRHLLELIVERLQPRQLGVQRLLCSLALVDGTPLHFPVGLLRPSLSVRHLAELVGLHVERLEVPAEVADVTLRAVLVAPLEFHQGQMFDGGAAAGQRQLLVLLEQLGSRLGAHAVLRPELRADPQPEFACQCGVRSAECGVEDNSSFRTPHSALRTPPIRPPQLLPEALPVEVVSVVPEGPPLRFWWGGRLHAVGHHWGPERIETGWWRGDDVRRDYYLVETAAGEWFWLFRTLGDERWFLHGVFA